MILNIILFKNKKIDTFTQPQFTDIEPEKAAIQLSRSLLINEDEMIDKRYEHLDMFVFGTFDDNTGEICPLDKPRLLLNCTEVILSKKKKGKVITNESREDSSSEKQDA